MIKDVTHSLETCLTYKDMTHSCEVRGRPKNHVCHDSFTWDMTRDTTSSTRDILKNTTSSLETCLTHERHDAFVRGVRETHEPHVPRLIHMGWDERQISLIRDMSHSLET